MRDYLELLFGGRPGKLIVSHSDPRRTEQGKRAFVGKTMCSDDLDAVAAKVEELDADTEIESVYVRMSTVREDPGKGKRGGAADTYASVGLFGDADFGTLGHSASNLPADADQARKLVQKAGLPDPSVVVNSGGGLYPIWLLDPAESVITDHAEYERLSKRWNNVIGAAAAASGLHYDSGVGGDIARVLRVAGTENRKEPLIPRPCQVVELSGRVFTRAELLAAVEEAETALGVTAVPALVREPGEELDDFEAFDAGQHVFSRFAQETTWPDLMAGRFGWEELAPETGELHRFRRPEASSEYSAKVLEVEPHVLVVWSDSAGLPSGAGQKLTKGRVLAHLEYDGDEYAATVALEKAYETGGELEPFDLFDQTPILAHIRQAARAERVGPWALLGNVLGRVLAEIPPHVRLPPLGGASAAAASLDLGFLSVGASGVSKSKSRKVSKSVLGAAVEDSQGAEGFELSPSTGAGIAAAYLHAEKTGSVTLNVLNSDPRHIWKVDEMATIEGYRSMSGNTLMGDLRKALMGEGLGQANATQELKRDLPDFTYRFIFLGCVHPEKADGLLSDDEIHQGTPQRFVWSRADDPGATEARTPWPGALDWEVPIRLRALSADFLDNPDDEEDRPSPIPGGVVYIRYPESVLDEIDRQQWLSLTSSLDDPSLGHLNLTRLKVGAALAFLHGETEISEQWWNLAGVVVNESRNVQEYCRSEMLKRSARENTNRARAQGRAEVVKQDTVKTEQTKRDKMRARLLKLVEDEPGVMWNKLLRQATNAAGRDMAADILGELVDAGTLRTEKDGKGHRVYPG